MLGRRKTSTLPSCVQNIRANNKFSVGVKKNFIKKNQEKRGYKGICSQVLVKFDLNGCSGNTGYKKYTFKWTKLPKTFLLLGFKMVDSKLEESNILLKIKKKKSKYWYYLKIFLKINVNCCSKNLGWGDKIKKT